MCWYDGKSKDRFYVNICKNNNIKSTTKTAKMHGGVGGPVVGGSNVKDPLEVRNVLFKGKWYCCYSRIQCNSVALIHTKYMNAIFDQESHILRAKVSEHVILENISDYTCR